MVFQPVLVELNELLQYMIFPWLVHFKERLKATCSVMGKLHEAIKGLASPADVLRDRNARVTNP